MPAAFSYYVMTSQNLVSFTNRKDAEKSFTYYKRENEEPVLLKMRNDIYSRPLEEQPEFRLGSHRRAHLANEGELIKAVTDADGYNPDWYMTMRDKTLKANNATEFEPITEYPSLEFTPEELASKQITVLDSCPRPTLPSICPQPVLMVDGLEHPDSVAAFIRLYRLRDWGLKGKWLGPLVHHMHDDHDATWNRALSEAKQVTGNLEWTLYQDGADSIWAHPTGHPKWCWSCWCGICNVHPVTDQEVLSRR